MAEKQPKSKLKRNKSSVKDLQPEMCSRGTLKKSRTDLFSSEINVTAEAARAVAPAAAWWNSEQLPAAESLWALTLKSALPYLENQHWHLVPDLPQPDTAGPAALKSDEQRWCDLSEEVAPLPEASPPSGGLPLRLSASQHELSGPGPDPPDTQLPSHSRHSRQGETTSPQGLTKRPQPCLHSWEGPASSAGPSSVGGGEQEVETGPVNKLTNQVKVSDRVSLQREGESKEEEEVQRSVRGDGGAAGWGGLQSCPLCLLEFPAGFTQMDCDGHLAQCLLEVNVDVTW